MSAVTAADIGVLGGSGFYEFLDDAIEVPVETPYGAPSDPPVVGAIGERRVAFIPRHGRDHRFPPHRIPYRANMWALRMLGVRQVLAPCAVGSLRPDWTAGHVVIPDQLVDRTSGRDSTYYDEGAVHIAFADPYCARGGHTVAAVAREADMQVASGGTMVVINGPRFSTRAESQSYAASGWSLVNMTGAPEAALARELALCYTAIALVTDLDAGIEQGSGVTQEEVFTVFGRHLARLRDVLYDAIGQLSLDRDCACASALDGIDLPMELP